MNNTAGLFIPAVVSDLGFSVGSFTLYFSVAAIVTLVFLPIGGKLMAKYDARQVVIVSIILQAGSLALFGAMSYVWGWYILAVPMSIGGTMITVIVGPVLINQWFKKYNGLALGILTAAGGLFGAVSSPIVASMIANQGWRFTYFAIGLFSMAVVIIVAIALLRPSPQAMGIEALGVTEMVSEVAPDGETDVVEDTDEVVEAVALKGEGIPVSVARKSVVLPLLGLYFFFSVAIASFSQHIPNHLANVELEQFGGTAMSVYMIGVLAGSLLLGWLVDVLSARVTAIATMVTGIVSMVLLLFSGSIAVVFVAVGLFGLVGASYGVVAPAMVSALFGKRDYAQLYSLASMGLAIASIVALPAYGFIFRRDPQLRACFHHHSGDAGTEHFDRHLGFHCSEQASRGR